METPSNKREVLKIIPKTKQMNIAPLREHGIFYLFNEFERLSSCLLTAYQRKGTIDNSFLGSVLGMAVMLVDAGKPHQPSMDHTYGGTVSYTNQSDGKIVVDICYSQRKGGFISPLTVTEESHQYVLNEENVCLDQKK